MADHVIYDTLAPLKGDNDGVMLVATLQLVGANQHLDLLLVQDLDGVGAVLQPPDGSCVFLLVDEAWAVRSERDGGRGEQGQTYRSDSNYSNTPLFQEKHLIFVFQEIRYWCWSQY